MTRPDRITVATIGLAVVALAVAVLVGTRSAGSRSSETAAGGAVLRADTHRLDTASDGEVTLVEFLDFECEACRAAYPTVERLREKYAGRITFAVRYFPIPSHRNAENAAWAVEAAARQDRLEPMYRRMYETQASWGESQDSKADLFRSFAVDLGLDLDQYDADVGSDAVRSRVQRDVNDGTALGVSGTPTFFLNGERLQVSTAEQLIRAVDDAMS